MVSRVTEFEGKWEEIVQRSANFEGQRVRVTILPADIDEATLRDSMTRLLAAVDADASESQDQATSYQNALIEKYRRQGFKL